MTTQKTMMKPPWQEFPEFSPNSSFWGSEDAILYQYAWRVWFNRLSTEEQQAYMAQYPSPEELEFYTLMKPPWQAFPECPQTSPAWGDGDAIIYRYAWREWFDRLSREEQLAYIAQYPEPDGWFEFYTLCVKPVPSWQERQEIRKRIRELHKAYYEEQSELALRYERDGNDGQALTHLGNAILCNGSIVPRWDDAEAFARYVKLKRRVAVAMAETPAIRESWEMLTQSAKRVNIILEGIIREMEVGPCILTPEEYDHIMKAVFFPCELGWTWTKWMENDSLFIHPHWTEPCLFLVIFQPQLNQTSRIVEAWMNPDPAIPCPSRFSSDPAALLHSLLGMLLYWGRRGYFDDL